MNYFPDLNIQLLSLYASTYDLDLVVYGDNYFTLTKGLSGTYYENFNYIIKIMIKEKILFELRLDNSKDNELFNELNNIINKCINEYTIESDNKINQIKFCLLLINSLNNL